VIAARQVRVCRALAGAYAVANEAIAQAVLAIDSFAPRPRATLRPWLYRILMNCIRAGARKEKRLRAHEVNGVEFVGESDRDVHAMETR
jgi:DNA-directed RNA polymerase specialized sigma24 family protein